MSSRRWNVLFVVVEAGLISWAHFVVGVSWAAIGLGLGTVMVLGAGLAAYVVLVATPRAIGRHRAMLRAHLVAHQGDGGRLHEVVDSQSTPDPVSPSSASGVPEAT